MTDDEATAILRRRAIALARPLEAEASQAPVQRSVVFELAGEPYAIDAAYVREVFALKEFTPVPCTPDFVIGIANLRGEILSILDLKQFFGLPAKGISNLTNVLVIHSGEMRFGILADSTGGIVDLRMDEIREKPATFSDRRADYVLGVTEQAMIVLDIARIVVDERLVVNDEV